MSSSSRGKEKDYSGLIVMDENDEDDKTCYTKKEVHDMNGIVLETHDVKIGCTMDHRSFRDDPMNNVDRNNKNWSMEDLDGYIQRLKEHLIQRGKLSKANDELYFFVGDYSFEKHTTYRRVKDIEMYVALDSDITNVISTQSVLMDSDAVLLKYYAPTKTSKHELITITAGTVIYRNHRTNLSWLGRYNSYGTIRTDILRPLSKMIPQLKFYIPDDSYVCYQGSRWFREVTGYQMCSIIRQDVQGARKRKQPEGVHQTPNKVGLDEIEKLRLKVQNKSHTCSRRIRIRRIKSNGIRSR